MIGKRQNYAEDKWKDNGLSRSFYACPTPEWCAEFTIFPCALLNYEVIRSVLSRNLFLLRMHKLLKRSAIKLHWNFSSGRGTSTDVTVEHSKLQTPHFLHSLCGIRAKSHSRKSQQKMNCFAVWMSRSLCIFLFLAADSFTYACFENETEAIFVLKLLITASLLTDPLSHWTCPARTRSSGTHYSSWSCTEYHFSFVLHRHVHNFRLSQLM